MCIILFKKPGLAIDYPLLASSFHANPDGAGLMWPQHGKVRVAKGFMGWTSLKPFLEDNEGVLEGQPVNFHFRWRTHGQTDQANTHPYPVTRDHRRLTQLDGEVPYAVMHNGVIPSYLAPIDPFFSDTAIFIRDRLARRRGKRKMLQELRRIPGVNKFALMDGRTRRTSLIGHFSSPLSAHGYLVSNTSYESRKVSVAERWKGGKADYPAATQTALSAPTTPWTGAAHYGSAPYSSWEDYVEVEESWWAEQQAKEKRFLREAGWKEDLWSGPLEELGVVDKGECESCGEKATCVVYGLVLCIPCMEEFVKDGVEEEEEGVGMLSCPEGVG